MADIVLSVLLADIRERVHLMGLPNLQTLFLTAEPRMYGAINTGWRMFAMKPETPVQVLGGLIPTGSTTPTPIEADEYVARYALPDTAFMARPDCGIIAVLAGSKRIDAQQALAPEAAATQEEHLHNQMRRSSMYTGREEIVLVNRFTRTISAPAGLEFTLQIIENPPRISAKALAFGAYTLSVSSAPTTTGTVIMRNNNVVPQTEEVDITAGMTTEEVAEAIKTAVNDNSLMNVQIRRYANELRFETVSVGPDNDQSLQIFANDTGAVFSLSTATSFALSATASTKMPLDDTYYEDILALAMNTLVSQVGAS